MDFTWAIGGEAGFGIMTTGVVFSKIATRSGFHIFDYVEYPSLIRGGHNAYEVHVSDSPVSHLSPSIDILVCLNKETYEKHKSRLTPSSMVIYDKDEFEIKEDIKKIIIPFKKTLSDLKGQPVMKNTIALGASIALLGGDIDLLINMISEQFAKKGEEVINFNKQFAKSGFDQVTKKVDLPSNWLYNMTQSLVFQVYNQNTDTHSGNVGFRGQQLVYFDPSNMKNFVNQSRLACQSARGSNAKVRTVA